MKTETRAWIQAASTTCLIAFIGIGISANIFARLGNNHYHDGRYQRAIEHYDRAIALQPGPLQFIRFNVDYSSIHVRRGLACLFLNRNQEATADFTNSIRIRPNNQTAYLNRGVANSRLDKHQEAITDYSKSIELNPAYACSYANRALDWSDLGQHDKALDDLNKALGLRPNYAVLQ